MKEISYLECVKRCVGEKFILCNNVQDDNVFMERVYEYYFDKYGEEYDNYNVEVFQYFLTSASDSDINYNDTYLHGALDFVYNESLDLYVLCVTHWGTSWDYVRGCDVEY